MVILRGGGQTCEGIPVKPLKTAAASLQNKKVVVMGRAEAYRSIAESLNQYGLVEYEDYCGIEQFLLEWYWKCRNQVCLLQVDMAVTLTCTLNCKDCNMFIPYHEKETFDFQRIKENVDLFFKQVDYLSSFLLLGGEPLLNPDLEHVIRYIHTCYGSRIGKVCIVTNGTVVPTQGLLEAIHQYGVEVNISDYTDEVSYSKRFGEVLNTFSEHEIPVQIKRDLTWCEFGFPQHPCSNPSPEDHMHRCSTLCHGLNDKRYYYCNVAWSAGRLGRFEERETDYISLEGQVDKERLLNYTLGEINGGIRFCEFCGGFGSDNHQCVKAGLQMERTKVW